MPFYNWPTTYPTDRATLLTEGQAADIILNCRHRRQVPKFAAKYDKTETWIDQMRRGRGWWKLRQKLKTGWRP